ncbi:MAG TPA: GNAT family N-acetyltransferase [Thermoplasmata archaeon]|nr:GNAT family N-acetyltransferase [Thermoplasmata archaeon]
MDEPRPATSARRDDLVELTHALRRELRNRGESPTGNWVEDLAEDLHTGRIQGWYYGEGGAALGFQSMRSNLSFGHVHTEAGPLALDRAERLVDALREHMPPNARAIDVGLTGLSPEEERTLWDRLGGRPGAHLIVRCAMEREIAPEDAAVEPRLPTGLRTVPVRDVSLEALADLDCRAFRHTEDSELFGTDPADYRRVLEELFDSRLGRFLEEASVAVINQEGTAVYAALITSEQSPRQATYLDLMVDPERQRAGLGTFLVRWGFRTLRALGYGSVRLWVTASNAPARALYERTGFRQTATASIYRWSRPDPDGQPHSG